MNEMNFCVAIWESKMIKLTIMQHCSFNKLANTKNFTEFKEISADDYLPTPDDIIRARNPTTGAHDYNFRLHNLRFNIHDMGGHNTDLVHI